MFPGTRWLAVAAVALGVVSAPLVPRLLPATSSDITAMQLTERIRTSGSVGWSGEVRAQGRLNVPISASQFGGIARLFGEQTDLRVWWRASDEWRIDRLRTTGETDLVRDGGLAVRWNYEDTKATFTPWSNVRLPDDLDVVPSTLARRLLAGAVPDELSRLPARRIAGTSVPGLRLVPRDTRSTIHRVDIWADARTGVPLQVKVYADPANLVLTTTLSSLTLKQPARAATDYVLSPTLKLSRGFALDEAAGANAFAPFDLPGSLVHLQRRGAAEDFGAVGVYGEGPTSMLVLPVRDFVGTALAKQLRRSANSRESGSGVALEVGPISVLLVRVPVGSFLLTGTIDPADLERASAELLRTVVRTR
ncbi:MAG: hypothetical protein ABIN79_05910 [Marmoricola sp.]